jgi:hypothetical protein
MIEHKKSLRRMRLYSVSYDDLLPEDFEFLELTEEDINDLESEVDTHLWWKENYQFMEGEYV